MRIILELQNMMSMIGLSGAMMAFKTMMMMNMKAVMQMNATTQQVKTSSIMLP